MLKIILSFAALILAFPIGYFLAYLTKDELIGGRKYFVLLSLISFVLAFIFLFFNLTASLSLFFIFVVTMISVWKSYDRKFVK